MDFENCMQDTTCNLGENQEKRVTKRLKLTEFNVAHFLYFESVIPSKIKKEFWGSRAG